MSDTPSIILVNGSIHTVDIDNSVAEAIAIQGDRISLVGSNTDVRAQARSETKVIDLAGRTVTPGFIDAHQHFA
ncbi:MAG: amidohydrolase, partial [Chloroflexota bacterium]|nr:amidohydrolase [Chloroflexota bacterium]